MQQIQTQEAALLQRAFKETFMAQKQERVKGENRERAASYYPFYTKEGLLLTTATK